METGTVALIGMAGLAFAALAAVAWYRVRQRKHVRQVGTWVTDYLVARYGELPDHLNINCSADSQWPVLVAFDSPRTGARHSLQFACPGPRSAFSLLSEKEENRS
jgi:hypothetical protein